MNLFGKAFFPGHFHPFFKALHIVNALGLDKISAGIYFFGQADHPVFKRIGKRIGCRTDEHTGRII